MLIIHNIKLVPGYTTQELINEICHKLNCKSSDISAFEIDKASLDARRKPDIFWILSVVVSFSNEKKFISGYRGKDIEYFIPTKYEFPAPGPNILNHRPVIVGCGPAGLFSAYLLALHGYKPIIIERGPNVEQRSEEVKKFWETGILNPEANVLFGEGGAGTFSDGKLNTQIKDKYGRYKEALRIFVEHGADKSIMYDAKPHIGTDILVKVVQSMRSRIIQMGGEFHFNTKMTGILHNNGKLTGIEINNNCIINTDVCILAIGHSARDTFELLNNEKIKLSAKDFAVGFRIEHPQKHINKALYSDGPLSDKLPPGSYKLTYKSESGKGVYSFCMCPGGYVVNASSEDRLLCINGMSYSKRDSDNANSAIVVNVTKEDFGSEDPLCGMKFQRKLEKKAYEAGNGKIPISYYADFKNKVDGFISKNDSSFDISPCIKGDFVWTDISNILPSNLNKDIIEGIEYFARIIDGFNNDKAILSAVESRTSSPVRIERDEHFESISLKGLYPAGEGAGYAGGITSAAIDGMKIAEEIASRYMNMKE